jgi:hypothetical protein
MKTITLHLSDEEGSAIEKVMRKMAKKGINPPSRHAVTRYLLGLGIKSFIRTCRNGNSKSARTTV